MSFSGKKYRRIRSENLDELLKLSNTNENIARALVSTCPIFCFTRIDEKTFDFNLQCGDKVMTNTIRLGEETEMERRDGSKVKVTYVLEGDNILKQVIKQPDGKIAYFKREFGDKETKMTVTMAGTDMEARIFYELVQ